MRKLLAGCLVVTVIAVLALGVAAFLGYRAAKPMIDSASGYMARAGELASVGDRLKNKTSYSPPANKQLTSLQVDRFLAVQARVRATLGERWSELERKSNAVREKASASNSDLSLPDILSVFSDFTGIYVEARRAQVDALNIQKFSDAEYSWVRLRVYEAAGLQLAGSLDLAAVEKLARDGAAKGGVQVPPLPKADVPPANLELVAPHIGKLREWLPMAFLGL